MNTMNATAASSGSFIGPPNNIPRSPSLSPNNSSSRTDNTYRTGISLQYNTTSSNVGSHTAARAEERKRLKSMQLLSMLNTEDGALGRLSRSISDQGRAKVPGGRDRNDESEDEEEEDHNGNNTNTNRGQGKFLTSMRDLPSRTTARTTQGPGSPIKSPIRIQNRIRTRQGLIGNQKFRANSVQPPTTKKKLIDPDHDDVTRDYFSDDLMDKVGSPRHYNHGVRRLNERRTRGYNYNSVYSPLMMKYRGRGSKCDKSGSFKYNRKISANSYRREVYGMFASSESDEAVTTATSQRKGVHGGGGGIGNRDSFSSSSSSSSSFNSNYVHPATVAALGPSSAKSSLCSTKNILTATAGGELMALSEEISGISRNECNSLAELAYHERKWRKRKGLSKREAVNAGDKEDAEIKEGDTKQENIVVSYPILSPKREKSLFGKIHGNSIHSAAGVACLHEVQHQLPVTTYHGEDQLNHHQAHQLLGGNENNTCLTTTIARVQKHNYYMPALSYSSTKHPESHPPPYGTVAKLELYRRVGAEKAVELSNETKCLNYKYVQDVIGSGIADVASSDDVKELLQELWMMAEKEAESCTSTDNHNHNDLKTDIEDILLNLEYILIIHGGAALVMSEFHACDWFLEFNEEPYVFLSGTEAKRTTTKDKNSKSNIRPSPSYLDHLALALLLRIRRIHFKGSSKFWGYPVLNAYISMMCNRVGIGGENSGGG